MNMKYNANHFKYIYPIFSVFFLFSMTLSRQTNAQEIRKDLLNNNADSVKENKKILNFGYDYSFPEWMTTRSISTSGTSNFDNSFYTNFGNRLKGRIAGLTVMQSNNEPGSDSPTLFSRGIGTFGPGKNPLVIVDGFESPYEQLVPEEIESITLLKDAASSTMYGMRGANGVLLITTKRGKEGPLKIELTMQTGFEKPYRLPKFLNSYDYARLYNEARMNDGLSPFYSDEDLKSYKSGNDPYFHPNVDWYDELLRASAPVSEINLNFSGGQNRVKYFVLLNLMNRGGLYKKTEDLSDFTINSNFTQYNIRTNVDLDITNKLLANVNLGFTVADKQNPGDYTTNSIFNLMSTVPPNAFPVYNPNGTYGGNSLYSNPWGDLLEKGIFTSNYRTSQSSLKLTQQLDMITSGLSISAAISLNNAFRGYSSKYRTYERFAITKDESGNINYQKFGQKTSLTAEEWRSDQWRNTTFQASLNYEKTFGGNQIDVALGFDENSYVILGDPNDYKHLGGNVMLNYAYQKKYLGEFSLGYYGANGFPKNKRFGLFPGISLGWIISNENFFPQNNLINYLKLRSSFGIVGNDNISNQRFMYDQYYNVQGSYIYGSEMMWGLAEAQMANANLTWEKKKEWNIGLDAKLFKYLNLSVDYFNQLRYDILSEPLNQIPQFAGIIRPLWNLGEVKNNGFEIQLGYLSPHSDNFNFFTNFNISYTKNKITKIPELIQQYEYQQRKGKSVNQPFLLDAIGFFQNEDEIINSPVQVFDVIRPGDLKYKDQNNDGIIDQRDFYPMGYSNVPELTAGLNVGIEYKKIYINLFFQGMANRSVYLSGKNFYAFQNDGKISSIALGRWTENNKESATYPRLSSQNNMNNFQPSSFWQRDGSFVKLENAEIGYSIPTPVTKKIGIPDIKIFINGTDLFTLDHVKIADPEVVTGYPATKTYSFGLKFQL